MSFQSTLSQLLGFLALTLSWGIPLPSKAAAQAAPLPLESGIQKQVSAPAPAPLVKWLQEQIEAANRRDLEEVMAGYSPDFRHRDGLDRQGVERAIRKLWEAHPQLTYAAEILSWRRLGPEIVAEIASQVQGSQSSARGEFQVQASALVRNRYRPNAAKPEQLLLVEQEVLREASTLTSGSAPPHRHLQVAGGGQAGIPLLAAGHCGRAPRPIFAVGRRRGAARGCGRLLRSNFVCP